MRGVMVPVMVAMASSVALAQSAPAPTEVKEFDPEAPPPSGWRLMLSDLTILRLNPIGLETRGRFGLQKRLYYKEKTTKTNFTACSSARSQLNPAEARTWALGGGSTRLDDHQLLRVFGEVQQFFGTFGHLQSFASADANYSDERIKDLRDDPVRDPQATQMRASIQPMLMAKVGPIALRALF